MTGGREGFKRRAKSSRKTRASVARGEGRWTFLEKQGVTGSEDMKNPRE